jgi:Zn finger protein HypA/HybF involved in hydrogenase expression
MKIRIENGYKYATCEQCGTEYNVAIQFKGWYICPVCSAKNWKKRKGRKE